MTEGQERVLAADPGEGPLCERVVARAVAPPPDGDLGEILSDLARSDPDSATRIEALVRDRPAVGDLVRTVAVEAPFLRDLMRVDAARLESILAESPERRLAAACAAVAAIPDGDEAALMAALRRARSDVALTVALADLGGVWPLDRVVAALSDFAEAALQRSVAFALAREVERGKLLEGEPARSGYFLLAMGKFGARELNYSSDIDLIALYDPDRARPAERGEATRLFVGVTKRVVKVLQERTADGYVFRVDLRLRPDPGSTTVALSTVGALNYYESSGQNWERAAMIKARPVAGDLAAGNQFVAELRPFVWRKYLDYSAIADVHSIKRQIHVHKGHGRIAVAGHNIKVGRGGIREIEFFVQTQQLIAGGRSPALRGRETLTMLQALVGHGWIDADAAAELAACYRVLRRLEHRIQMLRDEQTHVIPERAEALTAVARLCGHGDMDTFKNEIRATLQRVQHHYGRLFEEEPTLASADGSLVFTGDDDDPETLMTLQRMGFQKAREVSAVIRGWHTGRYNATRTERAREHLTVLIPVLLEAIAETRNADQTFIAFDRFLSQLPAGIQLFALLRSNPGLMSLLTTIMGAAPRLARTIMRRAHVLDAVLDPEFFGRLPDAEKLKERLSLSLQEAGDYEDFLNRARIFGQEQMFLIGVRIITGTLHHRQAGRAYALLADILLEAVFARVSAEFEAAHGRVPGGQTALLALGKLGGREMTASSDLDLILLYNHAADARASDGGKPLAPSQYYIRLTQRLISALSAPTSEGTLYELDFRLRPSGNAGPLATHISSFDRYQHEKAWTWEHMAITRARVVFGDTEIRHNVETCIRGVLATQRNPQEVRSEVAAMRARIETEKKATSIWEIKTAPGGLIDIEFIVQYLQLAYGASYPEILDANTNGALARIRDAGLIGADVAEPLIRASSLYESLTQVLRLAIDGRFEPDEAQSSLKAVLARVGEMPDFATLEADLTETQAHVRTLFERVVGEAGEAAP